MEEQHQDTESKLLESNGLISSMTDKLNESHSTSIACINSTVYSNMTSSRAHAIQIQFRKRRANKRTRKGGCREGVGTFESKTKRNIFKMTCIQVLLDYG